MMNTVTQVKVCPRGVIAAGSHRTAAHFPAFAHGVVSHSAVQKNTKFALSSRSLTTGNALLARHTISIKPLARAQHITRCGWGDPVDFSKAKVTKKSVAAKGLFSITLDVGKLAEGYTTPGQYVQMKVVDAEKVAYIAIACPPGSSGSKLEFLIKPVEGAPAGDICALEPGAELEVSDVQGKGFPMDKAASAKTVLLFATGSGISPVKALIEALADKGGLDAASRDDVRLYYGAQTEAQMAFKDDFAAWENLGVTVCPVYSNAGEKQYVQDAFKADPKGINGEASDVAVVLCGQKEMSVAVTEMMEAVGVTKEQMLANF